MPTAEGVFPKVGGDPGYYSEVNYLARGGGIGTMLWRLSNSGTTWQDAGSIIVNPGSICRDNSLIMLNYSTPLGNNTDANVSNFRFLFSGANNNFTITAGSQANPAASQRFRGRIDVSLDSNSLT